VGMKGSVFWDRTPCSPFSQPTFRRNAPPYSGLTIKPSEKPASDTLQVKLCFLPLHVVLIRCAFPKFLFTFQGLHDIISQNKIFKIMSFQLNLRINYMEYFCPFCRLQFFFFPSIHYLITKRLLIRYWTFPSSDFLQISCTASVSSHV
jgi:hypothetical protein